MLATITETTNLFVNLITILVIVAGFWAVVPYARGKRQGQAIDDLEKALNAARKRIDSAEETAREAKQEAQLCHVEMEKWKARYEEAQRYSAREAVEHFEAMMADHSNKVAERHEKMLKHLEIQTEANRNLAELIGHNMAISAGIAQRLGVGAPLDTNT